MSDRIYTVSFVPTAVTAQVDLFELTPADDKPIEVVGIMLGQNSDVGDAQDEILNIQVIRNFTTSGSGGSAPTPAPVNGSDAAAGFTAEVLNTTLAVTGTTTTLHSDGFNVRVGYQLWLPEGCEWQCSQATTRLVIRTSAAPADSISMFGTVYVRELG